MKIFKNPWFYSIVILLALVVLYIYSNNESKFLGPGEYDEFAKYLTEQGVKMYGTEWCSHCKNQKKLFGNSFQYVDYVDCDKNKKVCIDAGVEGYPTWVVNEENYPGEQSLERLAELSGYGGEI